MRQSRAARIRRAIGRSAAILINASTNSRKYLADQDWQADFEASVASVVRTLRDFSVDLYVLLSSVDVYNVLDDPAQNGEDARIDPLACPPMDFTSTSLKHASGATHHAG